jgi:predicted nucleic acid-binding protein
MRGILWDADAFICARALSLLKLSKQSENSTGKFWMTGFIAHHELNGLQMEVRGLVQAGLVTIEDITARSPAYKKFQELRKSRQGLHKGESEAIAWAMQRSRDERPLFISNDTRARKGAKHYGVPAGDLMDLAVEMIDSGLTELEDVKERLGVWDDRSQDLCRPGDYDDFDSTFQRRRERRP